MMFPAGMNCWECGHLPLPKADLPKAEGEHQTLKWNANPILDDGNLSKARQYFNCSYIHDRTITCTLFNDPGPDDIIEAFVHKKGDKMEMHIIDYYPPDGTIMSTTPPVKDKVDPTIPYTKPDTTDFQSTPITTPSGKLSEVQSSPQTIILDGEVIVQCDSIYNKAKPPSSCHLISNHTLDDMVRGIWGMNGALHKTNN